MKNLRIKIIVLGQLEHFRQALEQWVAVRKEIELAAKCRIIRIQADGKFVLQQTPGTWMSKNTIQWALDNREFDLYPEWLLCVALKMIKAKRCGTIYDYLNAKSKLRI